MNWKLKLWHKHHFFPQQLFLVVCVLVTTWRENGHRRRSFPVLNHVPLSTNSTDCMIDRQLLVWLINWFCPLCFSVIRHKPRVILNVAHSLISHLSPFLRQIDYALDWMHVEAGRAVYRYKKQQKSVKYLCDLLKYRIRWVKPKHSCH